MSSESNLNEVNTVVVQTASESCSL